MDRKCSVLCSVLLFSSSIVSAYPTTIETVRRREGRGGGNLQNIKMYFHFDDKGSFEDLTVTIQRAKMEERKRARETEGEKERERGVFKVVIVSWSPSTTHGMIKTLFRVPFSASSA